MESNFTVIAPCWSTNVFDVYLYCRLVVYDFVSGYQHFRGTSCLSLHLYHEAESSSFLWNIITYLLVMTQKTMFQVITIKKTSDLIDVHSRILSKALP